MYKFYQEEFERSRTLPDSITGLETSHMNEKKERSELAKATSKLNSESTNPWQKAQQEKLMNILETQVKITKIYRILVNLEMP